MHEPAYISDRALALKPSLTLAISDRAKSLRKEGKDICSLSAGEPDFDTPIPIVEAAAKALRDGYTRYGPAAGDPELRDAIADKITKVNNIPTERENVLVTNGGKQAIFNLLQVILNPGDEVLIPSPYWLSYPEIVTLAGAKPIIIESNYQEDFKIDINKIESSITERTKLLIINSPSNPTGRVITHSELSSVIELMNRYTNLLILSDEIYEFLVSPNHTHYSIGSLERALNDRIFTVNGFAKAWAMTGWRIGYLSGPKDIIKAATALQSQSTSNVCSFAQRGALEAITNSMDSVFSMAKIYNSRRDLLIKGLKSIQGMNFVSPSGAFYAFPRLPDNSPNSLEFCKLALDRVGLSMVPGFAFGDDKCIRLSCAVPSEIIEDGLHRLNDLIKTL